jgi:endonuclease III related protein
MKILEIYCRLLEIYGPQNWWPTTIDGNIHPTYNNRKKLTNKHRYEIAVGAILTQNTNWHNVEKAIVNLNRNNLLCPDKIINSPDEVIESMIKPSGYYRLKTKRLKSLTEWWLDNNEKVLMEQNKPGNLNLWRSSLLSVWGVGQETADSILLYCYDFPTFVIDTYTKRIMNRHMGVSLNIKYEDLRRLFMNSLPVNVALYKEFHALFVLSAKKTCKKNECLPECPLA